MALHAVPFHRNAAVTLVLEPLYPTATQKLVAVHETPRRLPPGWTATDHWLPSHRAI
jgi:hypothetical protein